MAIAALAAVFQVTPAHAGTNLPEWVRPAVRYLAEQGYLERDSFAPNQPMKRRAFKALMHAAFGRGYKRERGYVDAGEVSAALVRVLGKQPIADALRGATSPDGWTPEPGKWFGTEIVAREMELRRDRATSEEALDASATEQMLQADVAWAVWKAKTDASTWGADALASFGLANYDEKRREIVKFATSLVGAPYVWGGEWASPTPSGYPYGAQTQGGFDCSGFVWYVLQAKSSSYDPPGRPYAGWKIPERASYDMAKGAPKRIGYKGLRPADIVFFSPDGRDAKAGSVYHAGLYLGRGWMIHSSGGRAGISLASIAPGSWWHDQVAWGRRVVPV